MEHARPPSELCFQGGPADRADAWRKWFKQFEVFLKASGVYKESSDVKTNLLINLIGAEGYDVYTTFKFESVENKEDFALVVNKFNEHFGSKQNTTLARFKFFTRNQECGISSPSELLMGRRLNTRLPSHMVKLKPSRNNDIDYKNILMNQQASKSYYDTHTRSLQPLRTGDEVIMVEENRRRHGRVKGEAKHPRSYFVTDSTGKHYRRNRRHLIKLASGDSKDANKRRKTNSEHSHSQDEWSSADSQISSKEDTLHLDNDLGENNYNNIAQNVNNIRVHRQAAVQAQENISKMLQHC